LWHYLTFIGPDEPGHGLTLHCLHAFGFPIEGENEYAAEEFKGRSVKVDVDVEPASGQYKAKNVIKDFHIVSDEEMAADFPKHVNAWQAGVWTKSTAAAAPAREAVGAGAGRSATPPPPPAPAKKKLPWEK